MFRYRAIRKRPKFKPLWHLFQLADCPALLWSDTFFLAGKPNTPVMCLDTIVRGLHDFDMFEGDYVKDIVTGEVLGIVVYDNGFYMQKTDSDFKKTIPLGHIYIDKGDAESVKLLLKFNRTPIRFKYLTTIFDFGDLVSVEGDTLNVIVRKKHQKISLSEVSELLYYDEATSTMVFEGDVVNGVNASLDNIPNFTEDNKLQ